MALKNVFEKLKQSNHLSQMMLTLVKACGNDRSNSEELTRIISADPSLSSKLLQIISSPYVNLPKEVSTIKTAVVYLGLDTIRNIAISSSAMHFSACPETCLILILHASGITRISAASLPEKLPLKIRIATRTNSSWQDSSTTSAGSC